MATISDTRRLAIPGEAALNAVHPGGFRHAEQSVRVVEVLEKEGQGLNLTWEVRDGILNHRTAGKPSTLEGQVVRLCDKIAYIHHDMDDAIRAGILSEDDIPITIRVVLGDTCRERLNTLIHDIVEQSRGTEYVRQSAEIAEGMRMLRELMFANVYRNPPGGEKRGGEGKKDADFPLHLLPGAPGTDVPRVPESDRVRRGQDTGSMRLHCRYDRSVFHAQIRGAVRAESLGGLLDTGRKKCDIPMI